MAPQISVIFPVWQREAYLAEALESVLVQEFTDFELLVILDGSPPGVQAIVEGYRDARIRVLKLPVNMGISAARNVGLAAAQAPYLAFMDSDDVSLPHRLSVQHAWMQANPQVPACGGNSIKQYVDGRREPMLYPQADALIKARLLLVDSALHMPTVMARTDFFQRHGLRFDPNFPRDESHRLFVEIVRLGGSFYGIQEDLLIYRRHPENATQDQTGVDAEKTRVRELLLPLYFPELTGHEQRLLLRGFCQRVDMTLQELCCFVAVAEKAGREQRVFSGEDRIEVQRMLALFKNRALRAVAPSRS